MGQLERWSVCQRCGRTAARGTLHWLDLPDLSASGSGIRVVRCPAHWTEWAMRHTALGRTNDGRFRMRVANKFAEEHPEIYAMNPYVEPFPTDDVLDMKGNGP